MSQRPDLWAPGRLGQQGILEKRVLGLIPGAEDGKAQGRSGRR